MAQRCGRSPRVQGLVSFRKGLGVILSKTKCYRGGGLEKRRNMITVMPMVSHRGQVGRPGGITGPSACSTITQVIVGLEPKVTEVAVVRKH